MDIVWTGEPGSRLGSLVIHEVGAADAWQFSPRPLCSTINVCLAELHSLFNPIRQKANEVVFPRFLSCRCLEEEEDEVKMLKRNLLYSESAFGHSNR